MADLSPEEVRLLRTRNQHLHSRLTAEALVDAVRAVCGIQGQLTPAMLLAIRARVGGLKSADIEHAIADEHSLVRTWVMRGTLHLLASEDIRWIVALLGPPFEAKDKRRRVQLGVDEETSSAGLKAIRAILGKEGPLTRHELLDGLIERGVNIDPKGQALIHLIAQAALQGIICLGPDRHDGKSTYVLLDNWVEKDSPKVEKQPREKALAELARRYLAGFGPSDVKDFAAWSGLPLTDAKKGWQRLEESTSLTECHVEGRRLWMLPTESSDVGRSKPSVRLLPAFDTYVLGYADRDYLVRPEHQREVYHGGQTVPVVLVDGLASGVWRYDRQGKQIKIAVRLFDDVDDDVRKLIAAEAEDIGRFWVSPVKLTVEIQA